MGNDFVENGEKHDMIVPARAGSTSSSDASGNLPAKLYAVDESFRSYIESLKQFGFVDAETGETAYMLERTSYAHLAYYFRSVLSAARKSGTAPTVKAVHDVMTLDRRFQSVVFKYIGLVESQVRSQYSHWMKVEHGYFPHHDGTLFLNLRNYEDARKSYDREASRAKRNNRIIRESANQNGGKIPIDLAVQVMSLGVLSRFFSNTANLAVTHGVAASFGVKRDELSGWLRSIADTRNVFAHFGAYLSRAQMPTTPMKIRGLEVDNSTPPFIAYLVAYLLAGDVKTRDLNLDYARTMSFELSSTIEPFEKMYPLLMKELNFPPEWRSALQSAMELGRKKLG